MESFVRTGMALSVAGMLLLPVVGLLLRFQPQFVHGLRVNANSAEVNCYIGGSLYAATFLACGVTLALRARGWHPGRPQDDQDEVASRNLKYGLRFAELETSGFVRAMEALDKKNRVLHPPAKDMEQPKRLPDKAYMM